MNNSHVAFNCLTPIQWEQFTREYDEGDEMVVDDHDCDCESYTVGNHRCDCGNRRICIMADSYEGKVFFRCEAY